jgi:hypothetical protein
MKLVLLLLWTVNIASSTRLLDVLTAKLVDKNNDGTISNEEFTNALSLDESEEAILFTTCDLDGSGTLDHGELDFAQDMLPVAQMIGATWTSYFISCFSNLCRTLLGLTYICMLVTLVDVDGVSEGGDLSIMSILLTLKLMTLFFMWIGSWSSTAMIVFHIAAAIGITRLVLQQTFRSMVTAFGLFIVSFVTYTHFITTIEMLLGTFIGENSKNWIMGVLNLEWLDTWVNWSYTTFTKIDIDGKMSTALTAEVRFYSIVALVALSILAILIVNELEKRRNMGPYLHLGFKHFTWRGVVKQFLMNSKSILLLGLFALACEYYYPNFCHYNVIADPLTSNEVVRIIVSPLMILGMLVGSLTGTAKVVPFTKESWKTSFEDIGIGASVSSIAGIFEEIQFRWLMQPFMMTIVGFLVWAVPHYGVIFGLFHNIDWMYSKLTFGKLDDLFIQVSGGDEIYVHAAILCDIFFSLAHAHQGLVGILMKPIGCVYLRYFMYAYGFQGAILAHVLWDFMVLSWPSLIGMLLGIFYVPAEYYDRTQKRIEAIEKAIVTDQANLIRLQEQIHTARLQFELHYAQKIAKRQARVALLRAELARNAVRV